MDSFTHTIIAVGLLAISYYLGAFLESKKLLHGWLENMLDKLEKDGFIAEIKVGNRLFSESFVSKDVLFSPRLNMPGKIQVFYKRGPFEYLNNHWTFCNYRKNSCKLEFFIDFEIRKGILRDLFSDFFFSVAKKLTLAFEKRAEDLYSKV